MVNWEINLPPYRQPGDKLRSSEWNLIIDSIKEVRNVIDSQENDINQLKNDVNFLKSEYDLLSNDFAFFKSNIENFDIFIFDSELFKDNRYKEMILRNLSTLTYYKINNDFTIGNDKKQFLYSYIVFRDTSKINELFVYIDFENLDVGDNAWNVLQFNVMADIGQGNKYNFMVKYDNLLEISKHINWSWKPIVVQTVEYTNRGKYFIYLKDLGDKVFLRLSYINENNKTFVGYGYDNITSDNPKPDGTYLAITWDHCVAKIYKLIILIK